MTFMEFDDYYTAPAAGFENNFDYYKSCSTHSHLRKITTPTILLSSADDPFIPVSSYREAKLSPSIHLHIENTGGHMGYLSRDEKFGCKRWLDRALDAYLSALTAP
jgi:predicted alpha/beta-fold hydrolase